MPTTLTKGQAIVGKLYGNIAAGAGTISSTEIALANTKLLIGSTSGLSRAYALSGDVTVSNVGVATIGAKKVTAAMHSLANTKVVIGSTAAGGVAYALSGDVTMTNAGVVAIGAKKVTPAMMSLANTKIAIGSTAAGGVSYALSGDITMTNAGVTAIGTKKVFGNKIKAEWSTLSNSTKSKSAVSVAAVNKGYFVTNVGSSKGIVISGTAGCISNPTAGDWLKISIAATPSTIPIHLKSTAATFDGTNKYVLFNAVNDSVILEAISATRWVVAYANSVTYPAAT